MQVKLGPVVSDAVGSIGGTTFQRSFLGAQVRTKPLPTRRRSRSTNTVRGYIGQFSHTWRTLSQADRDKWQVEADAQVWYNKFGDVIRGKGYWLYMRCNQYLSILAAAPRTVPDTNFAITAITGLAVAGATAAALTMTWSAPTPTQASTTWLVFATAPMSPGRSQQFGRLRLITTVAAGTASGVVLTASYNSKFGGGQKAGDRSFFLCLPVNNRGGYPGVPVQVNCIWT